ncbi:MAG: alpha/beta fold hydrolase [Actinobacteria bacterium]|nr:alpha/beta fold hydrolase [Actinomycetota bacterium]
MTVEFVRTPDDRFADLPDFGYQPHYLEDLPDFEGLRLAYIDEGPRDAPVALCLHGEPSWSYLYRKMIPVLLEHGYRVVAPDWFGFGRSDKPVDDDVYTWDFHHDTMTAFVDALGLSDVTLIVQDWGGLLGLTLPVTHPELISRLIIMNTGFNVGVEPTEGFVAWRDYVANTPDLDVAELLQRSEPTLSDVEAAAYGAPFPGPEYKAGVRRFPQLVATSPDMGGVEISKQAVDFWANRWQGPTFMAIGKDDPVLGEPVMQRMRAFINGCPEPLILDVGHFVQEAGDQVATAALASWAE